MMGDHTHILKENAEALANLLTEDVPTLIGHYLKNGVLTEADRDEINSADSGMEVRVRLLETLGEKENVTLETILDGLAVTENHCLLTEINSLASKAEDIPRIANDDGSGDKLEEVSEYATNLVDEVISKAEETMMEKEEGSSRSTEFTENNETWVEPEAVAEDAPQKVVEADVEVHTNSEAEEKEEIEKEPEKQEVQSVKEEEEAEEDVPDKAVSFSTSATMIEDRQEEVELSDDRTPSPLSPPMTPSEKYQTHGLDAQQIENEDENIDIEKEFVMPPEASAENTNSNKVTNGGPRTLTRMLSNEIILDENDKKDEKNNNSEKEDLEAIMARKALVRQQVEKFEKTSPSSPTNAPGAPGKIKYSFRTASQNQNEIKEENKGSNVKNLKNFFQQLSNSTESKTLPSGPVKPVGKLKVTFPTS